MGLPLAEALSVLYVLCHEWMANRQMQAALGVKNPDRLDDLLFTEQPRAHVRRPAEIAAMGGEIGG